MTKPNWRVTPEGRLEDSNDKLIKEMMMGEEKFEPQGPAYPLIENWLGLKIEWLTKPVNQLGGICKAAVEADDLEAALAKGVQVYKGTMPWSEEYDPRLADTTALLIGQRPIKEPTREERYREMLELMTSGPASISDYERLRDRARALLERKG